MHVSIQLFGRWHDCDAFYLPFPVVNGFETGTCSSAVAIMRYILSTRAALLHRCILQTWQQSFRWIDQEKYSGFLINNIKKRAMQSITEPNI